MSTLTLDFDVERQPLPTAPYQRHSDTSKAAAQEIGKRLNSLQRAALELLLTDGPLTDNEAIRWTVKTWDWSPNTYRPRRRELEQAGFVAPTGELRKKCQVWAVTEAGREYLRRKVAP